MDMVTHAFEALGTQFRLTFWDPEREEGALHELSERCEAKTHDFDAQYSRFKNDSIVSELSRTHGAAEVPPELVAMLRLYQKLNVATGGKINPAIGFSLEDTGYDVEYSFKPKSVVRRPPPLEVVLSIEDDTHITLREPVLLDLGALGKGFLVDRLYDMVREAGVSRFLIDGSGDIRYFDKEEQPIVCGLEDPRDTSNVIGTLPFTGGALCASATNRRQWRGYTHYLDSDSLRSPEGIAATWVVATDAATADGLSSALFFVAPEALAEFQFEYLVLNHEMRIKKSAGFAADLFTV